MVRMNMKTALVCGAVMLLPALSVDGSEALHMRVYPMVSSAPASVNIYVGVSRRQENRLLRITAESPDFFRSSDVQLDGEASPRAMVIQFRDLPAGSYVVRAELVVSSGKTTNVERSEITIL